MAITDLMNAPAYDPTRDNRRRDILIGVAVTIVVLGIITFTGYVMGHGWFFSNLGYEHRVNTFFNALETKDYSKAYGIYYNDPDWQQHPTKYSDYPLTRFTEDWTTESPVQAPITSHHVDISKTDGSGTFGTGVIVAVRVNGSNYNAKQPEDGKGDSVSGHKVFMYVNRSDKTMTWPAPHELEYNP
jgi:hypothetical protein